VLHHRKAARKVDLDRLSGVEIGGGPDEWPGPEDLAVAENEEVLDVGSGGLDEELGSCTCR
jgi:hypothetical protein